MMILLCSCSSSSKPSLQAPEPIMQQQIVYKETIKNLSFWQGILIFGAVASIFAIFMGGAKYGIPLLVSSVVGYGMTAAALFYAKLIATLSLIAGGLLVGWVIYLNYARFKEVVLGNELFLKSAEKPIIEQFKNAQRLVQKPFTKKAVKAIKQKIMKGTQNAEQT